MKITFIFCVFNEYKNLVSHLKNTEDYISNKISDYEILLIDNNSTDGSREFIKNYQSKKINKYFNEKNIGKGGSTKIGIKDAKGEYLIIHDIDGEYNISDCFLCLDNAILTKSNLVIGSRVSKKNFIYRINFLGVIFLTKIINFLFKANLSDAASMPKLLEKKFIENINFVSNGFDLDFELITKSLRMNALISQINVDYTPRSIQDGKKIRAVRDGLICLFRILKDRLITKKMIELKKKA
jgi:dolichol-phosphate mannosyltransferase